MTGLPARLTYEVSQSGDVALTSFFEPNLPAGLVAEGSTVGAAVSSTVSGRVITITAEAPGDARLTIVAMAPGYRDTTLTVPIVVGAGVCPPVLAAGVGDAVPLAAGDVWRFRYDGTDSQAGSTTTGTVTMTFESFTCVGGTRRWTVFHEFAATRSQPGGGGGIGRSFRSTSVTETATNQVAFSLPAYELDASSATVSRRIPQDATAVDVAGTASCANLSPAESTMRFEAGRGLTRETLVCGSGFTVRRRVLSRNP